MQSTSTSGGAWAAEGAEPLIIRPLRDEEAEYALLARWLQDERIAATYGGRDLQWDVEAVRRKMGPRVLGAEAVAPFIAQVGAKPVAYVQYYEADADDRERLALPEGRAYGIDLLIGDTAYWGRGLCTAILRAMVDHLFRERGATRVIIDPKTTTTRMIRCAEKAGFARVRILPAHELHEGERRDCWLMEVTPDSFRGAPEGETAPPVVRDPRASAATPTAPNR